jgi:hypothetical protein
MDTKDVKCHEADYVEDYQDTTDIQFEAGEEKKLVRKIDLFLMPTIWLMYLMSYMDRTNIGNAKIAGMNEDLHLSSTQYSMALVIFFISYVFFEVPSNLILAKTRPSIFLPTIMGLWGIVTCCMAVVKDYNHLLVLRFVVGVLESGFAPGILLIISSWYKREEQSKRFAVYISAAVLSGAFGGLLAGSITSHLDGSHGLEGWRLVVLPLVPTFDANPPQMAFHRRRSRHRWLGYLRPFPLTRLPITDEQKVHRARTTTSKHETSHGQQLTHHQHRRCQTQAFQHQSPGKSLIKLAYLDYGLRLHGYRWIIYIELLLPYPGTRLGIQKHKGPVHGYPYLRSVIRHCRCLWYRHGSLPSIPRTCDCRMAQRIMCLLYRSLRGLQLHRTLRAPYLYG